VNHLKFFCGEEKGPSKKRTERKITLRKKIVRVRRGGKEKKLVSNSCSKGRTDEGRGEEKKPHGDERGKGTVFRGGKKEKHGKDW